MTFIGVNAVILIGAFSFLVYLNEIRLINYKQEPSINTLFIGDSHVKLAIDEKLIPNTANFSEHSESYQFSFYKIKKLVNNHSQIKKIYLGFSYHNLSNYYEYYVLNENSADIPARYFFITPFWEKLQLFYINKSKFLIFAKHVFKEGIYNLYFKKLGCFEGYKNDFENSKCVTSSVDKRILFQFYKNSKINDFSVYNLKYLHQIVALCKNNNIKLVLLNTPLHNYYKSKIDINYINKYKNFISENKLDVEDFNQLKLNDDCFVPDGDHVSKKGAKIVSAYLINKVRN